MLLYERINQILKKKNLNKKEFAAKFLSFEPVLKSTGVSPSMPTIYNYLNGTREIKAEMIPFIAKALDISEQELFLDDENSDEFFKTFIQRRDEESDSIKYQKMIHIINLLDYAPKQLIDRIIEILEKNKEATINSLKQMGMDVNLR